MATPTSDGPNGLGGRLPILHEGDLDEAGRKLRDDYEKQWIPWADSTPFQGRSDDGGYIGPFNPLLYSAELGRSFLQLQVVEGDKTSLDPRVRQVVILAIGSVWTSAYETYAHSAAAIKAGFTPDQADALARGKPADGWSDKEALAQHIALTMANRHFLDEADYRRGIDAFGERGMVDLTILAGCYFTICFLLNIFEVPVPPKQG